MSAAELSPAKATGLYMSVRVQNPKAGCVVSELALMTERFGERVSEVRYYVASPDPHMLGSMHLYGRGGYDERGIDGAMHVLERALGQLSFRRSGIHPPRPAGTPMSSAERRLRRDVALRLALDARDAYAAEVARLRERVEDLERRVDCAEREAENWQDVANELQERADADVGLTKGGEVVVMARVSP